MTTQRIPPPAWFAIALALIVVLHRYFPIASLVPTPWHYAGIGIASLGVVIAVWSVSLFRHVRTTIIPFQESTALITWGPYRFTRNPMYLHDILSPRCGLLRGFPFGVRRCSDLYRCHPEAV